MQTKKPYLGTALMLISLMVISGCWNYREVDSLAIVTGVAIDKGKDNTYQLTTEIIQVSGGKDPRITSRLLSMEGKTIFDAVRNGISVAGRKLYWSHINVVIISKDIVDDRLIAVLDWFNRDVETRADVDILVSLDKTAKEILEGQALIEQIKSIEMIRMIHNQKSLSKAPKSDLWKFGIEFQGEGISPVAAAVKLEKVDTHNSPRLAGSAVYKNARIAGYLNEEETKGMLFVKNEVKGGILVIGEPNNHKNPLITLEIFKNSTKIIPSVNNQHLEVLIDIKMEVGIDEIQGSLNLINAEGPQKIRHQAEERLRKQIEGVIAKSQKQLKTDIFGLGAKIRQDKPEIWRQVADRWEEDYPQLKVKVQTKVDIKNSAMMLKTLQKEE